MMTLFNKDYIMEAYAEELRQEGRQEGRQQGRQEGRQEGRMEEKKDTARNLAGMGLTPENIAQAVKVSVDTVKQWLAGGVTVAK